MKHARHEIAGPSVHLFQEAGTQLGKNDHSKQNWPAHVRVKLQLATRWARMGQDGHQIAQDRPKTAQVGHKMGQEVGKMGTKRRQEGKRGLSWFQHSPHWPKMGQEGGKMGTQSGQEDEREIQVVSKSDQKQGSQQFTIWGAILGSF